jgi:hypothetical protein
VGRPCIKHKSHRDKINNKLAESLVDLAKQVDMDVLANCILFDFKHGGVGGPVLLVIPVLKLEVHHEDEHAKKISANNMVDVSAITPGECVLANNQFLLPIVVVVPTD